MKRVSRGALLVVTIFSLLVMLAACQPPTTSTPVPVPTSAPILSPVPAPSPAPSTSTLPLTPNGPETSPPKIGGVLSFAQIAGPGGYDLHQRPPFAGMLVVPIYNNLVQLNPAYMDAVSGNIIGDLAKSWTIAPDGVTYTFILNQGVTWHDGKPFTADDVVYSLNKMLDVKGGSRVAPQLEALASADKVDDLTVKVVTKYPSAAFLLNLASGYCVIQPKHKAGADSKSTDFLVGTGPFKFKQYIPESTWELERNPKYFKKDKAGNALPYLDGLKCFVIKGGITAVVDAFIAKQLDMISPFAFISSDFDKIAKNAPEAKYLKVDGYNPYLLYFNQNFAPFKDKKVMQALTLVFNLEDQALARFGSLDFARPGPGIFVPVWGNTKADVDKIMGWDIPYDQRLVKAKQLLKESSFPDGFKLRLVYAAVPGNHSEASFSQYADMLKKTLGIQCELKPYPNNVEAIKARDAGEWEVFNETIIIGVTDPDAYAAYFKTGSTVNFMKYSNPELDKLWDAQSRELDPAKRRNIALQIEKIILSDRVVTPGIFPLGNIYYYPWVKNYQYTKMLYGPESKCENVWMDKK